MCAVLGFYLRQPTTEDAAMISATFLQSKIRGLHATGISWIRNGKIHTAKKAVPAEEFIDTLGDPPWLQCLNEDGNLYMIGHCRYSTSDLRFNQPISNDKISIVHNGVVTQELPDKWEKLYGYKCETLNDSELLLHTIGANDDVLGVWHNSSLSVLELHAEKKRMVYYRNGRRPLYMNEYNCGYVITSTADIAVRAGFKDPVLLPFGEVITISQQIVHDPVTQGLRADFKVTSVHHHIAEEDLQRAV